MGEVSLKGRGICFWSMLNRMRGILGFGFLLEAIKEQISSWLACL